jgi:flagellar basal body-associated protein FliL
MRKAPKRRKRNRAIMVLLLPVMAILWLIGWGLYWVGSKKQPAKPAKSNRQEDEDVTFTMLMPEQKHAQ